MRHTKLLLALAMSGMLVLGVNLNTARASVPGINDQILSTQGAAGGALSHDGRYVAFKTSEPLVAGDTNGYLDIFVKDRTTGTITRVSVASGGTQANNNSQIVGISDNGKLVVFESDASNLVPGDTNGMMDIFVHDTQTGATQLVSSSSSGSLGNYGGQSPMISGDGKFVVFNSMSTNLVSPATTGSQVYVKNLATGELRLLSKSSSGAAGNGGSYYPSISCDGGIIAFYSSASNLVASDTNGQADIFVVSRAGGDSIGNITATSNNYAVSPSVSCDGMHIAFVSAASNLVASDTNGQADIFKYDRRDSSTSLISISSSGVQGNASSGSAQISGDGRLIAWTSTATNLVSGDTNGVKDVFMRDTVTNATYRMSVEASGQQANGESALFNMNMSGVSAFSNDSKRLYFSSKASNLGGTYVTGEWGAFVAETGL